MEKLVKIAQTLRSMEVGSALLFPLEQYTSVRNVMYDYMCVDRANGSKWSFKKDLANRTCKVTRQS
jgi:hypothetical protein